MKYHVLVGNCLRGGFITGEIRRLLTTCLGLVALYEAHYATGREP